MPVLVPDLKLCNMHSSGFRSVFLIVIYDYFVNQCLSFGVHVESSYFCTHGIFLLIMHYCVLVKRLHLICL